MPAAKLSLDFDTRKFFDFAGVQVTAFTGKKNSIREYELTITQDNLPISLPDGTTIKVAMKKTSSPAGTLLLEVDAERAGWGSGSRWFYTLDLSGEPFAAVLGTNVDFELLIILADGQHIPSLTLPFAIEKNVML